MDIICRRITYRSSYYLLFLTSRIIYLNQILIVKKIQNMIFFTWHKKLVVKNLEYWKMSNYTAMWVSFLKGLIIGAIIFYYFTN